MTWRPLHKAGSLLLGVVVVTGLLLAPPASGGEVAGLPEATDPTPGITEILPQARGVLDYWTPARMRAARPWDLDPRGRLIDRADSSGDSEQESELTATRALTAPRTAGKLFFSTQTGDGVCSASTVNSARRNLIITAGHCVHSGPGFGLPLLGGGSEAFTNFLFVPRYANGSAPDGRWVGQRAWTFSAWAENGNEKFDQAFIRLAPRSGRNVVDVVGGNGLAWSYPPRENGVLVWGWPAQPPYDGEIAYRCAGPTSSFQGTGDAKIDCAMNGGASGGPWFLSMVSPNVGFVWAVTSRRTISGPPYLIAHPLPRQIRDLFVATEQTALTSAGTATTSTSTDLTARTALRPRLRLRALDPRVGRGQIGRLRAKTTPATRVVLDVRFRKNARWRKKVAIGRTNSEGVALFKIKMVRVGPRWYRARTSVRRTDAVKVRVRRCPLPLDERKSVVDATGCTAPSR